MSKKSKICILISILIIVIFGIFSYQKYGKAEQTSQSYTYDDLSDEQKVIADGVLEQYNLWKSAQDSGKNFMCTNVTFFNEDEKLIFAACYRTSGTNDYGNRISSSTGIIYKIFEVDSDGNLSGHGYSVYDSQKKNSAMVQAFSGADFNDNLSKQEKKDVLANELKYCS